MPATLTAPEPRLPALDLFAHLTRHLFFTGKGGVGKTSVSTATALALADAGRRVLLVSTDAASNLDEMLGVPLRNRPVAVPGAPGLSVLNIDPDAAAQAYRERVLARLLDEGVDAAGRETVREQLSGACTTEIAAFDEFATLLAGEGDGADGFDHLVFDTAPTGHTLRLLSLPQAWSGFLSGNDRGASCLGPHSGLKMQEARFQAALAALTDAAATTVVLVTRPEAGAIAEAARTAAELRALGLVRQRLIVNGVFQASVPDDPVARSFEDLGRQALAALPPALAALPQDRVPLRPFDTIGLPALRALLRDGPASPAVIEGRPGMPGLPGLPSCPDAADPASAGPGLDALVAELAEAGHGLILVMGKGGVGKTTLAAALALGLVRRGHAVHLSTTDPAAHVAGTLAAEVPGLRVDRIDPRAETQRYIDKIMAARSPGLDAPQRALLLEDLQSPCTEEVAVFHAFSRLVGEGRNGFVVLDTAPTGHSLLLMDATGAYHRQMQREFEGHGAARVVTPLMRLQDRAHTRVLLVTLPEVTPVSQAAALQDDLRRAGIEPWAWVLNRSVLAAGTRDPLLAARLSGERAQIARIRGRASGPVDGVPLARRLHVVPWQAQAPVGLAGLSALLGDAAPAGLGETAGPR